ncbi:CDP-glycerol glycerophosphotransferase (TagB/SpsB family) [Brevibacterium epidermidis]|jgi:CDP-glycerol glycerophosphotransferase (TagB/SpsB family)|uniref:CDP-glycerol glycerophosphotransferase (TagB/SpsB family) n=1 Tax=Brevibacterium epidermidis TaxID=1698 RepID=A0ABV4EIQ9_BREEP
MSIEMSLLQSALKGAGLTKEAETDDFWRKPLGKNAKAPGVRQQYFTDRANAPINKTVIFYETMSGSRMGDNPYGIFEYLRNSAEFGEFLHVWSIDSRATIPEQYVDAPDVVFARRHSHSYTYFLATAGYVVCNATLPVYFARRSEQKYLNTWHGIPYKALGRNTPKAKFGSPAGNATFTKATHILTPCKFTTEKITSAYSMKGVSNAVFAEIGYPRVDRTILPDAGLKTRLRNTLKLQTRESSGEYRPTVLYAPTWRSENDKDVVDSDQLLEDLKALAGLDIQLMYRGHHRMDRLIQDSSIGDQIGDIIIPPHDISSNDLLTVVDVLITDFSSIFFDFLPTGRPIVHYLYDLDEYERTRGTNLSASDLPGAVALTRPELVDAVSSVSEDLKRSVGEQDFSDSPLQGDRYRAAQLLYCPFEDGHSSKRAAEFLIDDKTDGYRTAAASDNRPTAAFWGGPLPAGPKSETFLKALLKSAASQHEQTVLIVERNAPIDKESLKKIKRFGDDISTFSYEPEPLVLLPKEDEEQRVFASQFYLDFDTATSLLQSNETLRQIYSREYRRRLDDARFDRVFLASDLSNDELALASIAGDGNAATADKWAPPTSNSFAPKQTLPDRALPKGSKRRQVAADAYRKLRAQVKRFRS